MNKFLYYTGRGLGTLFMQLYLKIQCIILLFVALPLLTQANYISLGTAEKSAALTFNNYSDFLWGTIGFPESKVKSASVTVKNISAAATTDGGDFSLDFTAAAPYTYDHSSGGGAFDDRTIGVSNDVVESLEGGDFACEDIVTFLTKITVHPDAEDDQSIDISYTFSADATGQSGVAFGEFSNIVDAKINYGPISGLDSNGNPVLIGDNPDGSDSGINDDGNSTATLHSVSITGNGNLFEGNDLLGTVTVTDLDHGETVVLRVDVRIKCQEDSRPTGNLQGDLSAAIVIDPEDAINVGNQTINLKNVNRILFPDCVLPPAGPVCEGETTEHTATTDIGGATYNWSITGSSTGAAFVGGGTTKQTTAGAEEMSSSVEVVAGGAGAYTLTVFISKEGYSTQSCEVGVTVDALPGSQQLRGGEYCEGDDPAGVDVRMGSSEIGVNYQLQVWDEANTEWDDVGAPKAGDGGRINFGPQPEGKYRVVATNTTTGCSRTFGDVTVTEKERPLAQTLNGGRYCEGDEPAGAEVKLASSQRGVTYQLQMWDVVNSEWDNAGAAIESTENGMMISFGLQPEGTYQVVATGCNECVRTFGDAKVVEDALPLSQRLIGGVYCEGEEGVPMGITDSETGVRYQLQKADEETRTWHDLGDPFRGTGDAIRVGIKTEGYYRIVATNIGTGCTTEVGQTRVIENPAATVEAGLSGEVCQSPQRQFIDLTRGEPMIGGGATTGTWTVSAFPAEGVALVDDTFESGSLGIGANYIGRITLTLTTEDPDGEGPCTAVSDTRRINVYPAATAEAGLSGKLCQSSERHVVNLTRGEPSVGGGATSGTWTIESIVPAGPAELTDASLANGTLVIGADYTGVITLKLTSNDPDGPCEAATDTRTITVNPLPAVSNGRATTCVNQPIQIGPEPMRGFSYSWSPARGLSDPTIANPTATIGSASSTPYIYELTITNIETGCSSTGRWGVRVNSCDKYCTLTQGFYGNEGGKTCYREGTVGTIELLTALLQRPLRIGSENRYIMLNSTCVNEILDVLPGGGGSSALPRRTQSECIVPASELHKKTGKINNSLLAQTITLSLNLRLDGALRSLVLYPDKPYIVTQASDGCGESAEPVNGTSKHYMLPVNVLRYLAAPGGYEANVQGLLDLANDALGGEYTGRNPSLSDISNAVDVINNAFDQCRFLIEFTDEGPENALAGISMTYPLEGIEKSDTGDLRAYPTPFSDKATIEFTTTVDENYIVRLYDMKGALVKELKSGTAKAGVVNQVEVDGRSLPEGLYLGRIISDSGSQTVKLLLKR